MFQWNHISFFSPFHFQKGPNNIVVLAVVMSTQRRRQIAAGEKNLLYFFFYRTAIVCNVFFSFLMCKQNYSPVHLSQSQGEELQRKRSGGGWDTTLVSEISLWHAVPLGTAVSRGTQIWDTIPVSHAISLLLYRSRAVPQSTGGLPHPEQAAMKHLNMPGVTVLASNIPSCASHLHVKAKGAFPGCTDLSHSNAANVK